MPFLQPSLRRPLYTEWVVILRMSTHNLFPVLRLLVMYLRGIDWQWRECVCLCVCVCVCVHACMHVCV